MAKRDLKYFMREVEPEIVTVKGPDTFKDENGNVLDFEIKKLSQEEITKINDMYKKRSIATDKKGNPLTVNGEVVWKTERDSAKASRHMLVEALVYPDLKDKALMEHYKCYDITDMPFKVFQTAEEYTQVNRIVMQALGMLDGVVEDEEDLQDAKN